ncbi:zinc-finger domain-containing protein [Paenibacillus frigoriresistens]|nr:zinc-finger domain-containing protein [Paenibacillus frigoriresistens]
MKVAMSMTRLEVVYKIDDILACCGKCKKRKELHRTYGSTFSKIDGYCNKLCPAGTELQELGKKLKLGDRRVVNESE